MEAEVAVKKTRARRSRDLPEFYRTDNNEDPKYKGLKVEQEGRNNGSGVIATCPYVRYIPLYYLGNDPCGSYSYREKGQLEKIVKQYNPEAKDNIPSDYLKSIGSMQKLLNIIDKSLTNMGSFQFTAKSIEAAKTQIDTYLRVDTKYSPSYLTSTNSLEAMVEQFDKGYWCSASMRTYNSHVGFFSAFVNDTPYITAVCTQQEYLIHRMSVLLGRPIDMTKVIILVDRRLDMPGEDDIPIAFKALYTRSLEPMIKDTAAKIMKVPLDAIISNCFINSYKMQAKKMNERKEEKEKFIDEFYYKHVGLTRKGEGPPKAAGEPSTIRTEATTVSITPEAPQVPPLPMLDGQPISHLIPPIRLGGTLLNSTPIERDHIVYPAIPPQSTFSSESYLEWTRRNEQQRQEQIERQRQRVAEAEAEVQALQRHMGTTGVSGFAGSYVMTEPGEPSTAMSAEEHAALSAAFEHQDAIQSAQAAVLNDLGMAPRRSRRSGNGIVRPPSYTIIPVDDAGNLIPEDEEEEGDEEWDEELNVDEEESEIDFGRDEPQIGPSDFTRSNPEQV